MSFVFLAEREHEQYVHIIPGHTSRVLMFSLKTSSLTIIILELCDTLLIYNIIIIIIIIIAVVYCNKSNYYK